MSTPPCRNAEAPFICPITYSQSEWSEVLRAYWCQECGPDDEYAAIERKALRKEERN